MFYPLGWESFINGFMSHVMHILNLITVIVTMVTFALFHEKFVEFEPIYSFLYTHNRSTPKSLLQFLISKNRR